MRIFLIRHGESAANVDHNVNKQLPDHEIPLSDRGMEQAQEAGRFLNKFLKDHPPTNKNEVANQLVEVIMKNLGQGQNLNVSKTRLWNSPYKRARETASIIGGVIKTQVTDTREDVLLCEQQFGLFDGLEEDEKEAKFPVEFALFNKQCQGNGKFWARFPGGESGFDVSCRLRQFNGTINRDEENGINDHIIVCHGSVSRLFTMAWLHYPYEWFEGEKNPGNCSIRLIDNSGGSGYTDRGYIFGGWKGDVKWKPEKNRFEK